MLRRIHEKRAGIKKLEESKKRWRRKIEGEDYVSSTDDDEDDDDVQQPTPPPRSLTPVDPRVAWVGLLIFVVSSLRPGKSQINLISKSILPQALGQKMGPISQCHEQMHCPNHSIALHHLEPLSTLSNCPLQSSSIEPSWGSYNLKLILVWK